MTRAPSDIDLMAYADGFADPPLRRSIQQAWIADAEARRTIEAYRQTSGLVADAFADGARLPASNDLVAFIMTFANEPARRQSSARTWLAAAMAGLALVVVPAGAFVHFGDELRAGLTHAVPLVTAGDLDRDAPLALVLERLVAGDAADGAQPSVRLAGPLEPGFTLACWHFEHGGVAGQTSPATLFIACRNDERYWRVVTTLTIAPFATASSRFTIDGPRAARDALTRAFAESLGASPSHDDLGIEAAGHAAATGNETNAR
ncbi:MAG: hypothetical protein NW205_09420 [Hyphomicrobiaceae bacterium]|nr:hypothetical protein [Hyphomicrobiaceae bacterium]